MCAQGNKEPSDIKTMWSTLFNLCAVLIFKLAKQREKKLQEHFNYRGRERERNRETETQRDSKREREKERDRDIKRFKKREREGQRKINEKEREISKYGS